jgi:hypothetical protein
MLGQHPQMYAVPETHLMLASTMAEWMCLDPGFPVHHGLWRAVAQLEFGEQTEPSVDLAQSWIAERAHWSTRLMLRWLASRVAPGILVEKSPSYSYDPKFMHRLLSAFPRARFLHLTRNPETQRASVLKMIAAAEGPMGEPPAEWMHDLRLNSRHSCDALNANIRAFLEKVPLVNQMRIEGVELLERPLFALAHIASWLRIDRGAASLDAMLHPERSPYARIGPVNATQGNDLAFLLHPRLG